MVEGVWKRIRAEGVVIVCYCSYSFHFSRKENDTERLALSWLRNWWWKHRCIFNSECTERRANTCLLQKEKHVTESGSGSLKSIKLLTKYDRHRDDFLGGFWTGGSFILFSVLGKFKYHHLLRIHQGSPPLYVNQCLWECEILLMLT